MNKINMLLLVFLFINCGFAQVGSEYTFKNDWEKSSLKGNVKTVKTALKITDNDRFDSDLFYKYNPVLHNYYTTDEYDDELFYKKFNTYCIMTERSNKRISSLNEEFETGQIFKIQIDSVDFFNKQKIASQCNFLFGMNPNKIKVFDEKSRVVEKYEYKTENQKIIEELYFDDYISDESPTEEIAKFDIRTLFFYNSNGLLVKKQIIIPEDEYDDNSTKKYYDQQIYNGNTLNYNYLYNEKNQLVKMTVYKKNKFLYQESYKIADDKVIEMEKLVNSEKTHNEFDTNKAIYKYDEHGNVTDLTYYDNDTGDEIITSIKFDYTFDNAKNWIACKMYLNKKSEIPDAVAERKFEYF